MPRLLARLLLLLAIASLAPARAADFVAPPGPYAVGSTNMQVAASAAGDRPLVDYLNGKVDGSRSLYVDELLSRRDAPLLLKVTVPANEPGAGALAGQQLPLLLYVLYPTRADNVRPNYTFPYKDTGDNVFPHMQAPGERPVFADAAARYPVIVYSGGYNTHGLWHLAHLKRMASHGYIVVDIFHGDGRVSGYAETVALRRVAFKAALDHVLSHPDFAGAVDTARIGASGASAGGQTVLAMLGGADPAVPGQSFRDARLKAGFGLVPFLGASFGIWPFQTHAWSFGRDFSGLAQVKTPFFAVYAEKDGSVSPDSVKAGVRRLGGPAWAVEMPSEGHLLSAPAEQEATAWELLFFDAYLRDNAAARERLANVKPLAGGRGSVNYSKPR
ncbi:alpha/beta hydrolase family protein [Roseateles sp. P5_E4]